MVVDELEPPHDLFDEDGPELPVLKLLEGDVEGLNELDDEDGLEDDEDDDLELLNPEEDDPVDLALIGSNNPKIKRAGRIKDNFIYQLLFNEQFVELALQSVRAMDGFYENFQALLRSEL